MMEGWRKEEDGNGRFLNDSDELRTFGKAGGKRWGSWYQGGVCKSIVSFTSLEKKMLGIKFLFFKSIVSSYIFRHDSLTCFWGKKSSRYS